MPPGISYIDYYVPPTRISICDLSAAIADKDLAKHGFDSKNSFIDHCRDNLEMESFCYEADLSPEKMISNLIQIFFDSTQLKPEDIDIIIVAQESYNYNFSNLGQYIQYQFKMRNAYVFNISGTGCINLETTLRITKCLLQSEKDISKILILCPQKIEGIATRVIGRFAVLGDGAAIALIDNAGKTATITDTYITANGLFYDMSMDRNFLVHYKQACDSIAYLLSRNHLTFGEIEKIIIPNANYGVFATYFEKFNVPQGKIYRELIGRYGHLPNIDFLINLKSIQESGLVNANDFVFSYGFGWAGNYQSTLLKMGNGY